MSVQIPPAIFPKANTLDQLNQLVQQYEDAQGTLTAPIDVNADGTVLMFTFPPKAATAPYSRVSAYTGVAPSPNVFTGNAYDAGAVKTVVVTRP